MTGINAQAVGEAHEFEDDAQKLELLDVDGAVSARSQERLTQIECALQKIADGTCGLSDVSGKPIPRERLRALPDRPAHSQKPRHSMPRGADSTQAAGRAKGGRRPTGKPQS